MDVQAMDMALDVCRVCACRIILFSHVGSLTVGKLVDKISSAVWYCDHNNYLKNTNSTQHRSFQIPRKVNLVCGLHVPRRTLTRLICPLPSPLLEQQTQQFRNVLQ